MILDVPVETPDTTPSETPMVATPVASLIHVPPPVLLLNVEEEPTHKLVVPVIAEGAVLIVTATDALDTQVVLAVAVTVYTVLVSTFIAVGLAVDVLVK